MNKKLESIDARFKIQAGLSQSGGHAMVRFSEFAENSGQRWVAPVERVAAIENKLKGAGGEA